MPSLKTMGSTVAATLLLASLAGCIVTPYRGRPARRTTTVIVRDHGHHDNGRHNGWRK